MAEYEFVYKAEKYLSENNGDLNNFYTKISDGQPAGQTFYNSLCRPDRYRLRVAEKMNAVLAADYVNSEQIEEAIDYLLETAEMFPEDHPIWSAR